MRRAVFIDRDGTLNADIGYAGDPSRVRLLPNAGEAVCRINGSGLAAVIVTNQSGVARGLITEAQVKMVNRHVVDSLAAFGAKIDGVYYCPHHPEGKLAEFTRRCDCRKPLTGLLEMAAADLEIDLGQSFMIGDKASDVEAGVRAGAKSILVRTGYGNSAIQELEKRNMPIAHVAGDVLEAVEWIVRDVNDRSQE